MSDDTEVVDVGAQLVALADPTRRAIYDLIRQTPSSVRELTDRLPISQPAVSQHLKVLGAAGLVTSTPDGPRRIYDLDSTGVAQLRAWIDMLWDDVLDNFADAARTESARTEAARTEAARKEHDR